MLETNIRIVYPGQGLYVLVRQATVTGPQLSADLLEAACSKLRSRHGLAAVKYMGNTFSLLVATSRPIPKIRLSDEEWELVVEDSGQNTRQLTLTEPDGAKNIPALIERALMIKLAETTDFWRINDSTRIWYEPNPFLSESGIDAYRRYRFAGLLLGDQGVGVAVDLQTAFFTANSLTWFFDPNLSRQEQENRSLKFDQLRNRQNGQKGTLLYDNGHSKSKCYFESAPPGITCATTGTVRVRGNSYDSLYSYYRSEYPDLEVDGNDQAVLVSFTHISKPQWVIAKQVRVRVMNEALPQDLSSVDKIDPQLRRELVQEFWQQLGKQPFGYVAPGVDWEGFWRPGMERIQVFSLPELVFGQKTILAAPTERSRQAYLNHYRQRTEYLDELGCYYVPPDIPRTLYFAYPTSMDASIAERVATDLTQVVQDWTSWTGCSMQPANPIPYTSVSEAVAKLRNVDRSGVVVFVLNTEPAAYHEISFQLERWRVKRITEYELRRHYEYFKNGVWDRRKKRYSLPLGRKRWWSFVEKNALAVLQLLEAVPFRLNQTNFYEAQLFIDVGHDRRHFALSLLVTREQKTPDFGFVSHVHVKADAQHEAINHRILTDCIVDLVQELVRRTNDPLMSMLVLRDGRFCGLEDKGVSNAVDTLKAEGRLHQTARVDLAELHKDSLNAVRLWEVSGDGNVTNPLEGTAVQLNDQVMVVASTGDATLHQGTASPYVVVSNGHCTRIADAAQATFVGAQLNWSSPGVAQRLPLNVKRTDEDLRERSAQEIRRYH